MRTQLKDTLAVFALSLGLAATSGAQSLNWQASGGSADALFASSISYGHYASPDTPTVVIGAPGATNGLGIETGSVLVRSLTTEMVFGTLTGVSAFDDFGHAVDAGGDVNGDGINDLVVGAPYAKSVFSTPGRAYVYSGLDLSLLYTLTGTNSLEEFGWSVAIVEDVTGDGRDDIAVGAPRRSAAVGGFVVNEAGAVDLFSGATGAKIDTVTAGHGGARFGWSVAGMPDADGDGAGEILVGEPLYDLSSSVTSSGRAVVLSGQTRAELTQLTLFGTDAGDQLGFSVAGGDVNADGVGDYVVGTPFDDLGGLFVIAFNVGYVQVRSGVDGSLLFAFRGPEQFENLGISVACGGDLDGDGYDDFIAGSPGGGPGGQARVWSGRTLECMYSIDGLANEELGASVAIGALPENGSFRYDSFAVGRPRHDVVGLFTNYTDGGAANVYFGKQSGYYPFVRGMGYSSDVVADVDGDSYDDLLYGIYDPSGEFPNFGWSLRSGKDGKVLHQQLTSSDCAGFAVAGIDDITLDGTPDFVVGNPCSNLVQLYSGADGGAVSGVGAGPGFGNAVDAAGDINLDGLEDIVVGQSTYDGSGFTNGGRVYVYRMQPGPGALLVASGAENGGQLGFSVAGLGDFDGDGIPDFAAGAPFEDSSLPFGATDIGRVYVYSGADGSTIASIAGSVAGDRCGYSVAGVGDVNADGFADLAIGEPYADSNPLGGGIQLDAGRVRVLAGPDASQVLMTIEGEQANMHLGWDVAGVGDVDRDGFNDLAVSAPDYDGAFPDIGLVRVYSWAKDAVIATDLGTFAGDRLGTSIGSRLDVGAEDRSELAAGAPNGQTGQAIGYGKLISLPQTSVAAIGAGCGPELTVFHGLLGELTTFYASNVPSAALLMISLQPGELPVGAGCTFYVDVANLAVNLAMQDLGGIDLERTLLVPDAPIFTGLDLYSQVLSVEPTSLGYALSQGMRVTLGY